MQPKTVGQEADCDVDSEKEEESGNPNNSNNNEEEDWMFKTFDKAKLGGKPSADKQSLDPFGELNKP